MVHDHSSANRIFLQIHLGGDRNFCYLVGDANSGEAAAIDPGFDAPAMAALATQHGLSIRNILITHGHADHRAEADRLAELTGAPVWAGSQDEVPGARDLADDQGMKLGETSIRALATPGHSPGHFCFLFEGMLITGDLLFCGKIGGTGPYFPGSDPVQQYESLRRIMQLPAETLVFPGHDYYGGEGQRPHSTVGHEAETNPFLTVADFDAFCHLKDNWKTYKEEHGIR